MQDNARQAVAMLHGQPQNFDPSYIVLYFAWGTEIGPSHMTYLRGSSCLKLLHLLLEFPAFLQQLPNEAVLHRQKFDER